MTFRSSSLSEVDQNTPDNGNSRILAELLPLYGSSLDASPNDLHKFRRILVEKACESRSNSSLSTGEQFSVSKDMMARHSGELVAALPS